jgi:hypothetical protein
MKHQPIPQAVLRTAVLLSAVAWLGAGPLCANDVLVARGSAWRHLDDGSDQDTAWKESAFDDSGWASAPAQLGYGDGDEASVLSFGGDPNNKHVTTYFRHAFELADPNVYTKYRLGLVRDDGAVVYLNGLEIARSNMPAGAIASGTFAASSAVNSGEDLFQVVNLLPSQFVAGTNVLAVEVHQRTLTSSDISFDLDLQATDGTFLLRGPYLQLGTPTSIVLRWNTDDSTDAHVQYGTSLGALTSSMTDPTVISSHLVSLSGLLPGTKYYYTVGSTTDVLAGPDEEHSFVTPPLAGTAQPTRIWAIGDSGTADSWAASVRDAYAAYTGATHTDLWLMLGDNAYVAGTNVEYQAGVYDTYPEMLAKSVVWPTRGNHDTTGVYAGTFTLPTAGEAGGIASGTELYYSFDHANVHFICLDSESSPLGVGGAMWNWLSADLAATNQDWLIAYWHHPPYTKGSHDSDTSATLISMRENFLPLLESGGVDLVLSGHSHSFERSFLIDGHYLGSTTFIEAMKKDAGDGKVAGNGAYNKPFGANKGAVYCVAGSSGKITGSGSLAHPAMYYSSKTLGSLVLDVDGQVMDGRFLTATGTIDDQFRLVKGDPGTWEDLGGGKAGISGVPLLQGSGTQIGGTLFDIQLSSAAPNALSVFFASVTSTPVPFLGGTLHAFPIDVLVFVPTDAGGDFLTQGEWPAGLPPGTGIWYQMAVQDGSVPGLGFALSNGLKSTSP